MRRQNRNRRKISVIDCETDPFKIGRVPKPFLWGYFDGDDYEEFKETEELVEFLSEKREIIYAHNGGKFDYFYMLEYLEPFADITIINGRIAKFKIGECEFRDSYNILPVPLAAYQKTEIDYNKFEKENRNKHMKEISAYLQDDCVFLWEFVTKFIKDYGVNLTLAGTALKQWKKISYDPIPETDPAFYEKYKKYYYGGRVECFEKGVFEGHFSSYDINSAYPYAMLHEHPYGIFGISRKGMKNEGDFKERNFYSIDATSSGGLPLRTDTGLHFPHERNIFHVSGWEILSGLKTNTLEIHEVLEEHGFAHSTCFTDYVNHFYEMKKKAKKGSAEYLFAKLFMNSLYGKFAANPEKYSETMILDKKYIMAGIEDGYEFAGELGPWALMRQDLNEEKQRWYNVATAASITGFVRAYMWEHLCKVREAGMKPLYCDTDCIFFEGDKVPFETGEELGQWDKEGEYHEGAIAGKKLYAFKDIHSGKYKKASKGCRVSGKDIFSIAKGNEVLYKDIAPVYSVYKEPHFLTRKIRKT